jgi:hypothetical protein
MKKKLMLFMFFFVACSSPTVTPVTTPPVTTVPFNKQQTERLRGAWEHTFKIINTFMDKHELTSVITEITNTPGDYLIVGKDAFGDRAGGGFNAKLQQFVVLTLHPSLTFDDAYIFNLDSSGTIATGCYYLYSHSGSVSSCYSLSGKKITSINLAFIRSRASRATIEITENQELIRYFQSIRENLSQ